MPSFFNDYWGLASLSGADISDAILEITDGDITIDLTQVNSGWFVIGPEGWQMQNSRFKGNGVFSNSQLVDGQHLKFTRFENVTETIRAGLHFFSPNGMLQELEKLNELLKVRAPRYWTNRQNNSPVYLRRKLSGETNISYALIAHGDMLVPQDVFDVTCTLETGKLFPITISFIRQPFWLGAIPGQAQGSVTISAQQDWDFALAWAVEDALPSGQVFCFAQLNDLDILAGGASEILRFTAGSWAVETTTPVTLAGNVTSCVHLANDDILFGETGRIIKLSGGVWSVETTVPTGQVEALLESSTGDVYAGDTAQIVVRDSNGTWAVDDTLPGGQVFSLAESTTGRLFAGEVGQILRTIFTPTSTDFTTQIITGTDDAEEFTTGVVSTSAIDLDFFQNTFDWFGLRFQSVTIPNGATINSAVIVFTAQATSTGPVANSITIYGEDEDTTTTFAETTNNISNRTTTTQSVSWAAEQSWIRNVTFESPDLSAIVQEIVDRASWASGNHLSILMDQTGQSNDRDAWAFDGAPGKAPVLQITYTTQRAVGDRWEVTSTIPSANVNSLLAFGTAVYAGDTGQILATQDDGASWGVLDTSPTGAVLSMIEDIEGAVYAGESGIIHRALDGINFAVDDNTISTGAVEAFHVQQADNTIRAGDSSNILIKDADEILTLGQEATTDDIVFLANHHKEANLTHIFVDDGGSFSNIFPIGSFPQLLLPAVPVVADAIYFGINTALDDTGPFNSVVFDIATPATSTTSYTITWEYWNGAWVTLTTQDGTNQFSEPSVQSVHWEQPSDWATVAVNSITGFWVRARLSALTGTLTPPTQQTRQIYSVISPFLEADANQAEGTVNSLVKLEIRNRSAAGGPGGSNPLLYQNRMWLGVKPTVGFENFRAFLNFADEQNPGGVSVSVAVDADSATSIEADTNLSSATGRRAFFDASTAQAGAGLDNMADRVSLVLTTDIATDYYGTYLVFVRVGQSGGAAGNITMRIKTVSGSGGITALTDTQPTQTTTDHHLILFNQPITLPVSALSAEGELGDQTNVTLQISSSSATADLFVYDLFLLPTDISYVDAADTVNNASSALADDDKLLVDSISIAKVPIRTFTKNATTDLKQSFWRVDSNGSFSVVKAAAHRIWGLQARTISTSDTTLISHPEATVSVKEEKVDRWILGRGLS